MARDGQNTESIVIRRLDGEEAAARIAELGAILRDAVENGASVNFLADVTREETEAFWRRQIGGIGEGATRLFVAEADGRLVGTVLLFLAQQPNAPHRAEIGKMLVHSAARRRGLGRRLLAAAETHALEAGRTLLMLDTQTDSAGERLYRACGWTPLGTVPGHALQPGGTPAPTTFFWKRLA